MGDGLNDASSAVEYANRKVKVSRFPDDEKLSDMKKVAVEQGGKEMVKNAYRSRRRSTHNAWSWDDGDGWSRSGPRVGSIEGKFNTVGGDVTENMAVMEMKSENSVEELTMVMAQLRQESDIVEAPAALRAQRRARQEGEAGRGHWRRI